MRGRPGAAGGRLRADHLPRRRRHDPARRRARPRRRLAVLGVNLGHVGFLAEAEREDAAPVGRAGRRPGLRRRGADGHRRRWSRRRRRGRPVWALNEATVEKAARERMLEVVLEVDGRPLSPWGCDGVVWRRPPARRRTRSRPAARWCGPRWRRCWSCRSARTRCSPGRWWSRPARGWRSRCSRTPRARGVLWCDGRRMVELPPGARIEVTRSETPVRLARLHPRAVHRPAGGQVRPAGQGWRGGAGPAAASIDRPRRRHLG